MNARTFSVKPVGIVHADEGSFFIEIAEPFRPALLGLDGFGHILVLWWCDRSDTEECRSETTCRKPYTKGPEMIGIFATRSPVRPNPIALSAVPVLGIDTAAGIIRVPFIDADDHTPVLDIKPYLPATERVRDVNVPAWSSHWPQWYEDNRGFDWAAEFTFGE
ncbi:MULTISPECIES: SAM-dependent methyltransferase [unclassified Methanoculleus]|jgi:tRNA-Thr(GGU) m(6)t(6)A37 methyltransferase TsaA|uniref:SAM-dependent methyltransferase n=1 Tax=Methanoculleus palmolei TaxID=72612 RepID=A0ABD8A7V1_9EURY|nr:SAM-dependent methyltransferase [Methanoculleus sp. UBA377]MDD2473387.1 SAM-dependent methyltransferase [Methanoculleus sp.]WOX55629.1 SAM-dependent methyltransferase [Methanoculleus palmolei]